MFPLQAFQYKPMHLSRSAWHMHMPFGFHLISELKPSILVELGVHRGDSYFTFCQSCLENKLSTVCYGVDLWEGDDHAGIYDNRVFEEVNSYNAENYSSFSYLMKSSFDEACVQFSDDEIQLLHIDGLHTYEAVKHDFETWFPKVKNNGIILLHDVRERKPGFGVWKFWQEIKKNFPSFLFDYGSGLGVIQKSNVNDFIKLSNTFTLDNKYNQLIQNTYSSAYELMKYRNEKVHNSIKLENTLCDLNRVKSQNIIAKCKIESIQSSFSWKLTSPLRFLRRLFIDPFQKHRGINFDPVAYLDLNPDLSRIVGSDLEAATSHFYNVGLKQGRRYRRLRKKSYKDWTKKYDAISNKSLSNFRKVSKGLTKKPLISLVMPVFNTPKPFLIDAIDSVLVQVYENWELCIVNDASTENHVSSTLSLYAEKDNRVRVLENSDNLHISASSNRGVEMAKGEFVALLDHDDLLRPHSLLRVVEEINESPEAVLLYSDEDKIDLDGSRTQPYFKPDWNPDLLFSQNYLCHFLVLKKEIILDVGGFREGYEGSQDWDLVLRVTSKLNSNQIVHIPDILYHWRIHESSVAMHLDAKSYSVKAAEKAMCDLALKTDLEAEVVVVQEQYLRMKRTINIGSTSPLISIIIPTRDNYDVLKRCLETIRDKTIFQNYEIIIIDNDSKDPATLELLRIEADFSKQKVLNYKGSFNYSAINNFAVQKAEAQCVLLLNDDIEITDGDWLEELTSQAMRKEIGAVGGKLFYPDGAIQHAGILIGYCGVAGELYKGMPGDTPGQMQRANLIQNVSAVTGACLAIEKTKYLKVGGLDEKNLKVAFNDVDFCLRLIESGFRNLYTPFAKMIHHESISRGRDDTPSKKARFVSEANYMKHRWKDFINNDPMYNQNLSLGQHRQFEMAYPPRKVKYD